MGIVLYPYDSKWVQDFTDIKEYLIKTISSFIEIQHIGSTSIVGMKAKPIIDIDIVIKSNQNFNAIKSELEFIGYKYVGNQGIPGREVFKRIENDRCILDKIKHHLYVCEESNNEYKNHILFRNALRNNKELIHRYIEIKEEILKQVGFENRKEYARIKEEEYKWFFEEVVKNEKLRLAIAST